MYVVCVSIIPPFAARESTGVTYARYMTRMVPYSCGLAILYCQHLTKPRSMSPRAISYRTEMDHRQKYHLPSAGGEAFVMIMDVACGEERSSGTVTTP